MKGSSEVNKTDRLPKMKSTLMRAEALQVIYQCKRTAKKRTVYWRKCCTGEAHMRDNPEGGGLDTAVYTAGAARILSFYFA